MKDDRYVAAIEISSSKIVAVIGKMHSDGRLDVIASDQERGVESVRHGIIQNLDETSLRITRVLDKLRHKPAIAPRNIKSLYVGLSGRSLRSITVEVELNLPDETEITETILTQLRDKALSTAIDNSLEVVDAIPRIYTVGKLETTSPKGVSGNYIHAVYDLIVCRPELRSKLMRTIPDKLKIPICGFVVTALATAQVILSTEEKRLGCMLVDMGAETTAVSIYKDGYLRYFATLPLGGRNITRDLTSLNILEEKAEELKIQLGYAMQRDTNTSINMNGIRTSDVSSIVVARSEEIVANIVEQINYAGLKDRDLPAGLICIGGGMKLNGMTDLLAKQTDLPVKRGQLPAYITLEDSKSPVSEILEVVSVLYCGASQSDDECLEMPGSEELPATGVGNTPEEEEAEKKIGESPSGRSGLLKALGTRIAEMFKGGDVDDSDLI
ncbi:MAG: cell division protein FtsA [Candidatus Amulumruptor caecigallinarius]|nr:cell division protein FtsA [Candidatus Amulumruptor caecigallinarius]